MKSSGTTTSCRAQGLEREAVLVAIKAEDLDSLNDEITSHGLSTGKVDCTQTSCTTRTWTATRKRRSPSCSSTLAPNRPT